MIFIKANEIYFKRLSFYERFTPSKFAVSSQVTIAAALAGKALTNVGPKPA